MDLLAEIRYRQARWGKRSLVLLVVAWFSVALQPCALALASDQLPLCPHCPPAHSHDQMGHAMAGDAMDAGAVPCAAQLVECANLDDINHGARDGEAKVFDPPNSMGFAVRPTELRWPLGPASGPRMRLPQEPCQSGAPPPLNVLFCKYLN